MEDPIKDGRVIKAMKGNECVGVIIWEEDTDSLFFGPLAIKVGCQNQGIGKKLIARVEELCYEKGKRRLDMVVVDARTDIIPMYEKMGFKRTGKTAPYYEPQYLTRDAKFVYFSKQLQCSGSAGV